MMPSSRWQEARNSSREIFSSSLWSIFCRKTDYNTFIFHDILHAFNNNEIKMETENVPWIKDPLCLWCATLLGILLCPSAHGRQWSHQSFPVLWWNHLEIYFFLLNVEGTYEIFLEFNLNSSQSFIIQDERIIIHTIIDIIQLEHPRQFIIKSASLQGRQVGDEFLFD